MVKQLFLEGDRIYLRPLQKTDINENYIGWLNDAEVCEYNSHHVFPYNRHRAEEYLKLVSLSKDILVLAIILKKGGKHIGNVSLQRIDLLNRNAEFAILLGDKNYWGKGIAKEASRLIIKHGIEALNLHRVYCGTSAKNIGMQKLADYLGMEKEGRRRQQMFKNGEFVDVIDYGLLSKNFKLM